MVGEGIERVDADEVELVPEEHVLRLVPVRAVGQQARKDPADLRDEIRPVAAEPPRPALALDADAEGVRAGGGRVRGPGGDEAPVALLVLGPALGAAGIDLPAPAARLDPEMGDHQDPKPSRVGLTDHLAHRLAVVGVGRLEVHRDVGALEAPDPTEGRDRDPVRAASRQEVQQRGGVRRAVAAARVERALDGTDGDPTHALVARGAPAVGAGGEPMLRGRRGGHRESDRENDEEVQPTHRDAAGWQARPSAASAVQMGGRTEKSMK